ncbi:uncharacterized protein LOC133785295 [Humulus lupulus]|uniref:uncharacterized protein LOC133785295 n=1 Tax=Humulus lupulus TaxID=3486 RepID=UPI002B41784F|nr:uncharacterized protein LOC133785295 [Humulus lupulus]
MRGNKFMELMAHKFTNWDFYFSPVTEGKILIIWRKTFVRVIIIEETNQYVHCVVKMASQRHAFSATFVYGLNTMEERKRLWKSLPRFTFPAKSWVILGDFNAIFTVKDRSGGKPVSKLELTNSSQWLARNQVESLKSTGSFFTWTNNQDGPARIYSKIDHVFTNEDWLDFFFPNFTAVFRWETVSDHCSCIISTTTMENMGVKLFRFYNFWTEHQDFKEVVLNSWRKPINGTGLKAIYLKTMRLKHRLKRFNRDNIGDIGVKYQEAKDHYQETQLQDQKHPRDHGFQELAKAAAVAFTIQEHMYHSFLAQRSKITLLRKGDMNTSYFHACLKKCKEDNRIATHLTEQGRLIDKFPDVVSHFLDHFRSFMGSPSSTTVKINLQCVELVQDLIKNYGRTSTSPRCAITIDLSKAYDTVDWWFLEDLLNSFMFSYEVYIGRIMTCLKNTTYSLLTNGRVQGSFKGEKGLRQGDPMSPLLFVLIMEYLTRSLQLEFSAATGLHVNSSKSHIFFGGVNAADRQTIAHEIQLTEGTFPLKYLGVPMRPTKWKHEDCDIIIQKIKMQLHTLASRHLSFAGRIQLIHSVLFGLRNYWMSIFVLPQSVVKEVEKLCCGFLWGITSNRSKIHIASWKKVFLPKSYGGLSFRDGSNWNQAILAKYIWAIFEKHDLLWVKWINSIYLKGSNLWNYKLKPDSSWYWRKLCHLRGKFNLA